MIRILVGDALTRLRELPDNSVHCCVTSPPYWGLRDYQTGQWEGGEEGCDHKPSSTPARRGLASSMLEGGQSSNGHQQEGYRDACPKCGARRVDQQIGMEESPDAYIARLVEVFREVKRVLRPDGVLWLNIGDSYSNSGKGPTGFNGKGDHERRQGFHSPPKIVPDGLKPKDLCMIPARVALALQADGWWLRSDIIWSKPNCMPESVTDRPTKSHEYIFLLAKSQSYYYDQDAIREPHQAADPEDDAYRPSYAERAESHGRFEGNGKNGSKAFQAFHPNGRNKRSVWTIPTSPFSEAHFACVDSETECLTSNGWKRHDELNTGDIIASFDMETSKAVWTPVNDVYRYDVSNQDMVAALGRTIDMMLTPNHRAVIYRKDNQRPKSEMAGPFIVSASELKKSHIIPVAADWDSDEGNNIYEPLARLIGWYITEGSTGKDTILLFQSGDTNPQNCDEIRGLLNVLGADYTENSRERKYNGRITKPITWRIFGAVANEIMSLCPGKSFPKDILLWSKESLTALWDSLMKGDGHFREGGRQSFVQKRKDIIDTVQGIAVRLGYSTTLRKRSEGTWSLYKTDYKTRMLRSETGDLLEYTKYTGVVWCPRTDYGTFVARRNGRVFITGNTFPPDLVEPMIKAGSSEKGCCSKCGAPWERVTERNSSSPYVAPSELDRFGTGEAGVHRKVGGQYQKWLDANPKQTTGWQPTCKCAAYIIPVNEETDEDAIPMPYDPIPCIVLDIFAGSGTTLMVADRLGRNAIGIELNPTYVEMAVNRIRNDAGLFADIRIEKGA